MKYMEDFYEVNKEMKHRLLKATIILLCTSMVRVVFNFIKRIIIVF